MSAPPISASDARSREDAAARAAGWRAVDVRWERLQEAASRAWREGNPERAARLWQAARWLAFFRFRRSDPRYAASLANAAMAARLSGRHARAGRLYRRALRLWSAVPEQVAGVEPARRARSSLFHLRMEARHWETYRANQRKRLATFVAEAGDVLEALAEGREPPHRLYERWRGEKPPVFDEGRKILSAALLIAAPPTGETGAGGNGRGRGA